MYDLDRKKIANTMDSYIFVAITCLSGNNNVSLGRNLIGVKIKMKNVHAIAKVCVDITVNPWLCGYYEIYEHLSPKNNFRIRF